MFLYIGYYYWDPTYIFIIIGMVISLAASALVKGTFAKYSQGVNERALTGAEVALQVLNSQGLYHVKIYHVDGYLTDHYDPRTKTLHLSDAVYNSRSIAAAGVAAHECGHAIQDAKGYVPLRLRSAIVPVANFGANISWILILIGVLIRSNSSYLLIQLGILAFSLSVLFQIVTLPVEFNASRRALQILENRQILSYQEMPKAKKVLGAAALTYVAAAAASILQLLRLVVLFGGRRNDD